MKSNECNRAYTLGRITMLIDFYKEGKICWGELKQSIDSELIYYFERMKGGDENGD